MARSGWAYTDLGYFNELGGMTGSIQFRTDCNTLSGSNNFVYASSSNRVGIREDLTQPGFDIQRGSTALATYHPNAALEVRGDMNVTGSIYAKNYYIQNVSFMDFTGSTKFGDSSGDTHQYIGSVGIGPALVTPSSNLEIEGDSGDLTIEIDNNATNAGNLKIQVGAGNRRADFILNALVDPGGGETYSLGDTKFAMIDQKIGVMTMTPNRTLDVGGDARVATDLYIGDDLSLVSDSAIINMGADNDVTFRHDGTTGLTIAATPITLDSGGAINIDSDTGDVVFKDGGTAQLSLDMDGTAGAVIMQLKVDSDDFVFKQYDGTEVFRVEDNASLQIGTAAGLNIANSSNDMVFKLMSDAKDMIFKQYDGNEVIRIADDRRLYFYDKGGEHIASDGTNLTITSGAKVICAAAANSSLEPATDNNVDLGSSTKRWANVYTGDLHLKNDRGDWTVVEEAEYLTLINNTNGKKFKIMMEEIED